MTEHRLRPWRPEDAHILLDAVTRDEEIARQLPTLETLSDAHEHIAKTAGGELLQGFVTRDEAVAGQLGQGLEARFERFGVSFLRSGIEKDADLGRARHPTRERGDVVEQQVATAR